METFDYFFFIDRAFSFKSYYVVWKPEKRRTVVRLTFGLNRTMQYGNSEVKTACDELLGGLNRTMQYGNSHHSPSRAREYIV